MVKAAEPKLRLLRIAWMQIYNTDGQLVASGSDGLWSGSILNPVEYDENGNSFFYQVWTGTGTNGTADGPLGEFPASIGPGDRGTLPGR